MEYAQNPGGFLGVGSNLPRQIRQSFFVGINVCMMLALCGFLVLRRKIPLALFVAGSYVLAGGIGNLIDRVTNNGLVTDFLNVGIGPLRTGVFNVADMAVTFGAVAAVILVHPYASVEQSHVLELASGSDSIESHHR